MAIIQALATDYGITASYHKIEAIHINWSARQAEVNVGSYVDKTTREQNAKPLLINVFCFDTNSFPFDFGGSFTGNAVAAAYGLLKNEPLFLGAQDDL